MDDLTFRKAEDAELDAVAALRWHWVVEENAGSPVLPRDEFITTFGQWASAHAHTHSCYVALKGREVIGMAWLAVLPRVPSPRALARASGDLQSVFVHPEYRNAGIGGQLIAHVMESAAQLGVERVIVHSSIRAIPAYQRAGFQASSRLMDIGVADPI
jgi:GNAT superfamily N-acetyltransferase